MASDNDPGDDAVIALLARDGLNSSRRPTNGNGSLQERRPGGPERKPNTNFLRRIVQSTDRHNAALTAKELRDSEKKLKELRRDERGAKRSRRGNGSAEGKEGSKAKRAGEERPGRWSDVFKGLGKQQGRGRKRRDREGDDEVEGPRKDRKRKRDNGVLMDRGGTYRTDERIASPSRSRSRSPRRRHERKRDYRDEHRSHRRRAGPSRSPSRSPHRKCAHRRRDSSSAEDRSRISHQHRTPTQRHDTPKPTTKPDLDSDDPLIGFLGPVPAPPKIFPRGRGANKARPNRFDPNYNPATEFSQNSDDENGETMTTPYGSDWELTLEAAKDRKRWQEKGAERLRAAGFGEAEVRKWENGIAGKGKGVVYDGSGGGGGGGGVDKGLEEVKWGLKGEGREWDRGKIVDESGETGFGLVGWKKGDSLGDD